MTCFGQLFSFETQRWDALFNGQIPHAKKYFAASAWEDRIDGDDFPDSEQKPLLYLDAVWRNAPPHIVAITEHVARYGISYSKLATDDAALLDATVVGFFCPEGLEPILPYTDEHLEGLSPQAVDELLSRDAPVRRGGFLGFGGKVEPGFPVTLANFLATGRRHGTTELPDPQHKYFIFNQEEVRRVLEEVSGLLAVQGRWRTPAFEAHICAELLPALQRAAKNNLMLAGRYT